MTIDGILRIIGFLIEEEPIIGDAIARIIGGHPSAQRVREILDEQGASARAVEALRAEGVK